MAIAESIYPRAGENWGVSGRIFVILDVYGLVLSTAGIRGAALGRGLLLVNKFAINHDH